MSLNKAMLIGNLGQDPELRYTQSGVAVCTLNLATSEKRKDKDGNTEELVEWHRVIVWKQQAENCAKYLVKGSSVYCEGRISTRKWEDKEGIKRYTTEITAFQVQFLSKSNKEDGGGSEKPQGASNHQSETDLNDIPF